MSGGRQPWYWFLQTTGYLGRIPSCRHLNATGAKRCKRIGWVFDHDHLKTPDEMGSLTGRMTKSDTPTHCHLRQQQSTLNQLKVVNIPAWPAQEPSSRTVAGLGIWGIQGVSQSQASK